MIVKRLLYKHFSKRMARSAVKFRGSLKAMDSRDGRYKMEPGKAVRRGIS